MIRLFDFLVFFLHSITICKNQIINQVFVSVYCKWFINVKINFKRRTRLSFEKVIKSSKNHWIQWFGQPLNSMVGCAGPFFLYNMNIKETSTEKSSLTAFTVGERLFGAFGAPLDCWYWSLTSCHRRVFEIHFPVNGVLVMSLCKYILDLKPTPDPPSYCIYQWCFTWAPLPILSWIQAGGGNCYCTEIMIKCSSHSLLIRKGTNQSNDQAIIC